MPTVKASWTDKIDVAFWSPMYSMEFVEEMRIVIACKTKPQWIFTDFPDPHATWTRRWKSVIVPSPSHPIDLPVKKGRGPLFLPHMITKLPTWISLSLDEKDPLRFEVPFTGTKETCALTLSPSQHSAALGSVDMLLAFRVPWKLYHVPGVPGTIPSNLPPLPFGLDAVANVVLCDDMHVYLPFSFGSKAGDHIRKMLTSRCWEYICVVRCTNIPQATYGVPGPFNNNPSPTLPPVVPGHVRVKYGYGDDKVFDMKGIDVSDPVRCAAVFNDLRSHESKVYGLFKFREDSFVGPTPWASLPDDVFCDIIRMLPLPSKANAPLTTFFPAA